jgi:hypothetical protein
MSGIRRVSDLGSTGVSSILDGSIQAADLSPTISLSGFRNRIINGDFRINQRGFTSTTQSTMYGFDRWQSFHLGGTTYSAQTFTAGNPIPGQEPINFARIVTESQSSSLSYANLNQKIEDVRTCAGQTVTVSFWAKSGSGTPQVRVGLSQNFGAGGSSTLGALSSLFTLSTGWQRFTANITLPSISGKTIGSSSFLEFQLWVSTSSNINIVPLQNNTFDFWGVQLEIGTQATPFEQRPIGVELALCQRYYWRWVSQNNGDLWVAVYQPASTNFFYLIPMPVRMRARPTSASVSGSWSYVNTPDAPSVFDRGDSWMIIQSRVNASIGNTNQSAFYSSSGSSTLIQDAEL